MKGYFLMRLLLCAFLLVTLVAAHAAEMGKWEEAYHLDPGFCDAERAVVTATDDLKKLQADPEAAQLSLVRAQEKLDEAQAKLRQTRLLATGKALTAVGDVLSGRSKETAATVRLTLNSLQLQAAQVRRQAGMISDQELARAKEEQGQASAALATAQRELLGAITRMKLFVEEAPDHLGVPTPIDAANLTLGNHPTLLAAQHQRKEAERALALAGGPDTAPLDLAARARDLQSAEDALHDTERSLNEALAAARRRYLAAVENQHLTDNSLRLALVDLHSAEKRFQAGAISRVAVVQANIVALDAHLSDDQALIEIWQARLALVQAVGGEL